MLLVEKLEAVDNQTLKFTLGKPDADFLSTLAASVNLIVAKEAGIFDKYGLELLGPPLAARAPAVGTTAEMVAAA